MMGTGPAGRWFTRPNDSGRSMNVRMSGGRSVVYGRVARRKDYGLSFSLWGSDKGQFGWSKEGYVRRISGCPTVSR